MNWLLHLIYGVVRYAQGQKDANSSLKPHVFQGVESPAGTPQERFFEALPVAVNAGWNPWCVYTQAHLESLMKPIGQNNFWGIISRPGIPLTVRGVHTHEEVSGQEVAQDRDFGDWPTCREAMGWYCDHIKQLYPEAYANRHNPITYFQYLGKWATEHLYPILLEKRYRELMTDKALADKLRTFQA